MRAAVLRYRVMAYITGVVLIILCFVGIPLQVIGNNTVVVNDVGTLHGILYIIYIIFAYLLTRRLRLAIGPTVLVLLAGTIPVLTFVVERWLTHRYIDPALAAADGAAGTRPGHHATTAPVTGGPALLHRGPGGRAPAGPGSGGARRPGLRVRHRFRRVLRQPAGPGHPGAAGHRAAPAASWPAARPRHRLRPDRAGHGGPRARRHGLGGGREHAGAGAVRRQCGPGRPGQRALCAARRPRAARRVRLHLVEPADPDRQGRAARPAGRLARPAGPRRAARTSSCSATWAPTHCIAGCPGRAGRPRGSPPGPATGCWR